MYALERLQQIMGTARAHGRADSSGLARSLAVTPETARRKLTALGLRRACRRMLRRMHGRAIPVERFCTELGIPDREIPHADKKEHSARAVLEELPDGGSILLDAGATMARLAELLPLDRELTVVAHSIPVARILKTRPNVPLLLLGGVVRDRTLAAVGDGTRAQIADIFADVAFMGADGVIVSLTLNPSLDRTVVVDRLVPGSVLHTSEPTLDSGGKGLNLALASNGIRSIAVLPIGGREGLGLQDLLDAAMLEALARGAAAISLPGTAMPGSDAIDFTIVQLVFCRPFPPPCTKEYQLMSDLSPTPTNTGGRDRIQRGGASLSSVVVPDLGVFIAFGLITALFIPTGRVNTLAGRTEDPLPITVQVATIVGLLILILIPLGYTGGKMIHGTRGGGVGAVATIGAIPATMPTKQLAKTGITVGHSPLFLGDPKIARLVKATQNGETVEL